MIFIIGHVLAPTAKHDYISVDFWAALNDVSKIKDWNWGAYVLKNLLQAVKKFKNDVSKRNPTIHIVGCHLFLQARISVFVCFMHFLIHESRVNIFIMHFLMSVFVSDHIFLLQPGFCPQQIRARCTEQARRSDTKDKPVRL